MKIQILVLIVYLFLIPFQLKAEDIIIPADHYPPWKIAQDGQITGGIDSRIIASLLDGSDLRPLYELCPWKRCLLMMEKGHGDLISGVTLNKERKEYLTYLSPPYKTKSQKVLYVPRGKSGDYKSLKDMEQKNIGILRGAKFFPGFNENSSISKKENNSDIAGLKMVMAGRVDGFLITKENGEYLLKENPQIKERLEMSVWRYDEDIDVYFAISKKSKLTTRITDLEKRLKHLVNSGEIEKIIQDSLR